MRLTQHTDYALRLLMLLAIEPNSRHTIEEVARRYGVSRNHMMKVANTLTQNGFLDGLRGRGGGLQLSREPAAIGLGDVIRCCEDGFALVECFDQARNACAVAPVCSLRGPMEEALEAFLAVFDRYSLADLVARPTIRRNMRQLLSDGGVRSKRGGAPKTLVG